MIPDLLGSIIVSGITTVLAYLVTRVWPVIRAMKLRRLCSIEGTFLTDLELKAGLPAIRQALTQISQQGSKIRGVTTEVEGERWWQLEGEIDASGFLRGIYRDGKTSDRVGSFLLAIENDGEALTGLLTGFDAVRQTVAAAQYSLQRCGTTDDQRPEAARTII